jgi:Glyoxalase-like domain
VDAKRGFPELRQVVLDSTDARALAEFYRQLLGLRYRPGDEPPAAGQPDPAVLVTKPVYPISVHDIQAIDAKPV